MQGVLFEQLRELADLPKDAFNLIMKMPVRPSAIKKIEVLDPEMVKSPKMGISNVNAPRKPVVKGSKKSVAKGSKKPVKTPSIISASKPIKAKK
ncbi:MAG: hypothetical protein ABSE72_07260, partial [Bacteroidales bacterium]|jgi:hypothetical protein